MFTDRPVFNHCDVLASKAIELFYCVFGPLLVHLCALCVPVQLQVRNYDDDDDEFDEIRKKGYYAVQGHSRSSRSVPIESPYANSY